MSELTDFGFKIEAAMVERLWTHKGHAGILVSTPIQALEIRITPSGLIRLSTIRKPYKHELKRRPL